MTGGDPMTTKAGRALFNKDVHHASTCASWDLRDYGCDCGLFDLVAAIETEAFNDGVLAERAVAFDAVTKERERIAAKVRADDYAAVLAAITERSTPDD